MPQFHITRSELLVKGSHCVAWSCGTLLSTLITRCHNSTQHSVSPLLVAQTLLCEIVASCYLHISVENKVPQLQAKTTALIA